METGQEVEKKEQQEQIVQQETTAITPGKLRVIKRNGSVVPYNDCLLYTSPSPRDGLLSRMPSSA